MHGVSFIYYPKVNLQLKKINLKLQLKPGMLQNIQNLCLAHTFSLNILVLNLSSNKSLKPYLFKVRMGYTDAAHVSPPSTLFKYNNLCARSGNNVDRVKCLPCQRSLTGNYLTVQKYDVSPGNDWSLEISEIELSRAQPCGKLIFK